MTNFLFPNQWYWLQDHQRRFRLLSGEGQVKVRLRSGQIRSNFKVFFCIQRYLFDAAYHGASNGGLSFVVRDQQRQKK